MTIKDPDAILDYGWNLRTPGGEWLAADETITSFAVVASPAGLTVAPAGHPNTESNGVITYWLAGGVAGQSYNVTCHVVTSAGREDDRTTRVDVFER